MLWIARLSFLSHSKENVKAREEKDRKERREGGREAADGSPSVISARQALPLPVTAH